MSYKKFQVYFFISVLIASLLLKLLVFRAYLVLIAFAGVLAILFRPVFRRFLGLVRSEAVAALMTVIVAVAAVLLPVTLFFMALYNELVSVVLNSRLKVDADSMAQYLQERLPVDLQSQVPIIVSSVMDFIRGIGTEISMVLFSLFSNAVGVFLAFIVILIAVYYLLKDGTVLKQRLMKISPLLDEYDELVLGRMITAVQAVISGGLVVISIKAVLAGVFFAIFGVPAPIFWGAMTGVASLLPIVGSALVTVPAVIYLIYAGHPGAAVGLGIISIVLIGTIDNFLQPKLVQSRTNIHPLLILLSILGGVKFYGFAGFILGPLTLAVTAALLDIYEREFRSYVQRVD